MDEPNEERRFLSLAIEETLKQAVRKVAEENDRTLSAEVRHALRLHVERETQAAA